MDNFDLNDVESINRDNWLKEHRKTCSLICRVKDCSCLACMGPSISYKFTLTGIGVAVDIICACDAHSDITDYGSW